MKRVLFVCTGNICRSPTAEGVASHAIQCRGLGEMIAVDSAGTSGAHAGEPPDPRSQKAAAKRGYNLAAFRARKLVALDFQDFDLLLAMDTGHLEFMRRECPANHLSKLRLFMDYARKFDIGEVPDPYYGGERGFEVVLDYCEDAVGGLIQTLIKS